MSDLKKPPLPPEPREPQRGHCYRHYAAGIEPRVYVVQGFAWPAGQSSSAQEWHVRYRCVVGDTLGSEFIRPVSEFLDTVVTEDGERVPRFTRVDPSELLTDGIDLVEGWLEIERACTYGPVLYLDRSMVATSFAGPSGLSPMFTVLEREPDVLGAPALRKHFVRLQGRNVQLTPKGRARHTVEVAGYLREAVATFADRMEFALSKKDRERGADGWRHSCSLVDLFTAAGTKLRTLHTVAAVGEPPTEADAFEAWKFDVIDKAAAVANFMMMIADLVERETFNPAVEKPVDVVEAPPAVDAPVVKPKLADVPLEERFLGMAFAFTGTMSKIDRKSAQLRVRERGGEVFASVNTNVDILVVGDEGSPLLDPKLELSTKHRAAEKLNARGAGIEIITEAEFLRRAPRYEVAA